MSLFAAGDDDWSFSRHCRAEASRRGASPSTGGLVYVLNAGDPSLAGFRLAGGGLEPLGGSRTELPAGADPAQVGFTPDGSKIVVTERGRNAIAF